MIITATATIIAVVTTITTIITTATTTIVITATFITTVTRVRVDAIVSEDMVVGTTSGVVAQDDTFLGFCFVAPRTTLLSITLLVRERRLPFTSAPACALGALLGAPLMTAMARGA